LAGCAGVGPAPKAAGAASSIGTDSSVPFRVEPSCQFAALSAGLLAVTSSGDVVAVNSRTLRTRVIAEGILADGGVAVRPELDAAYVTAPGPSARPAIWELSLTSCRTHPKLVEIDAELPSVSPDGGHLGFVTLDARSLQTGVAIVRLGATGAPSGVAQRFPATCASRLINPRW